MALPFRIVPDGVELLSGGAPDMEFTPEEVQALMASAPMPAAVPVAAPGIAPDVMPVAAPGGPPTAALEALMLGNGGVGIDPVDYAAGLPSELDAMKAQELAAVAAARPAYKPYTGPSQAAANQEFQNAKLHGLFGAIVRASQAGSGKQIDSGSQDAARTQAMARYTQLKELQHKAPEVDYERQAMDPNSPRSLAAQKMVASLGGKADGLTVADIRANSLIPSAMADARRIEDRTLGDIDKEKERGAELAEAGAAFERAKALRDIDFSHKLEIDKQKDVLKAARRRAGMGGGGGGGSTPASTETMRQALIENKVVTPEEAAALTGKEVRADHRTMRGSRIAGRGKGGLPGSDTGGKEYFKQREDGSITLNIGPSEQGLVSKITVMRNKAKVDEAAGSYARVAADIKAHPGVVDKVLLLGHNAFDPAVNFAEQFGVEDAKAGQDFVRHLKTAVDIYYGRPASGAAISAQEWKNFYSQLGAGQFSNSRNALAGINDKLKQYEASDDQLFTGHGEAGAVAAMQAALSPSAPPYVRKIAQRQAAHFGIQLPDALQDVKFLKNGTQIPVIMSVKHAKYGVAHKRGAIVQ